MIESYNHRLTYHLQVIPLSFRRRITSSRHITMLFKRILSSIPLLVPLLSLHVLSEPSNERDASTDTEIFQQLLDQVDPPALHSLLHNYSPKEFKHGMFREDRTAVEEIHRDNPPLAASIVSLAKRQVVNNVTTSNPPAAPPSSTSIVTDLNPSASNPNQISASERVTPVPEPGAQTTIGLTITPSASGSNTPAPTDTKQPSSTDSAAGLSTLSSISSANEAATSRTAGSVFTITNSFGVVIVTTVGGGFRTVASVSTPATATEAASTVSVSGSTTTIRPSQTSAVLHTSTLPNGSQSVVTAITVVGGGSEAGTPTGSAGVASSGTGTAAPRLQTGIAVRTGGVLKEMLCMVGGAVGVAMMM